MSKLLTALIAAGFGFGLNAAVAQDVKDRTDSNSSTGMSNQDNTSGQTGSDQTTGKKKRRMQQ